MAICIRDKLAAVSGCVGPSRVHNIPRRGFVVDDCSGRWSQVRARGAAATKQQPPSSQQSRKRVRRAFTVLATRAVLLPHPRSPAQPSKIFVILVSSSDRQIKGMANNNTCYSRSSSSKTDNWLEDIHRLRHRNFSSTGHPVQGETTRTRTLELAPIFIL